MIDLTNMIIAQHGLQVKLGYHFERMTDQERIDYIKENALALTDEVHEALAETGWKSWATSRHINYDKFLGELRDAWQFMTNMMLAAESDPVKLAEWFANALAEKHNINHNRIGDYDGVSTKCPGCKRALDEVSISEVFGLSDTLHYFCVCGAKLDPTIVRKLSVD